MHCLICRVGGRACALPIEHVREVMRRCPIERVALAPRFTLGVALIRGENVPVIDAGSLLEGQACSGARFVVLRVADRPGSQRRVALAVDEVVGTERLDPRELERLPPLLAAASETVRAMAVLDGRLVEVLETARLVDAAAGATEPFGKALEDEAAKELA
ncbi:MAG TPA: chemotaxis protein CheW [Polyangiaceae bacterium]|nr:chemotaxis protein CheW [Polyangiaceae bacterium]